MFNLLPESEKKILRREYARRRAFVFFIACGALIVIAVVMLIPSYVLSHVKYGAAITDRDATTKESKDSPALPVGDMQHIQDLLTFVGTGQPATTSSSIITTVAMARPKGIKILSISLVWGDKPAAQVRGISATRESLRTFTDALKTSNIFDAVDLPVSSFAKDADIPFTIGMTIHQDKPIKP